MKKILQKRRKNIRIRNQGNSYIMVVATLSFLAVLVAAILVAVALCYRLKAYDINARDNFYYLEQAMDEIYAGVGADSMNHLVEAYEDTLQVLVYFDPQSQSYVTMKNTEANRILKNAFIKLVKDDEHYKDTDKVKARLSEFITYPYKGDGTAKEKEGVQISVGNVASTDDDLTIMNLVLKREATYSTVNTRKNFSEDGSSVNAVEGDTFVQTITTDLVIGKPEFDVNFNTVGSELNDLYQFAMVADLGVEITGATSNVNITGNVYAASDFYNKDYNYNIKKPDKPGDPVDERYIDKSSDKAKVQYAAVSEYDWSKDENKDKLKDYDGLKEKSMYSGLYIDGASVRLTSDKIVVPGSIAAFNAANVSIAGTSASATNTAEVWADSIVLGGYSLRKNGKEDELKGSDIAMRANAYIYDDLELNAASSNFQMIGQYYGYNYSTLDNRTYTDTSVKSASGRTFTDVTNSGVSRDSSTKVGKAHYNSSAVIVNGENSSLDLSGVTDMYIAGQAYIELSKKKTTSTKEVKAVVNEVTYEDGTVASSTVEGKDAYKVEQDSYSYPEKSSEKVEEDVVVGSTEDEEGNIKNVTEKQTKTVYDNYTTNSDNVEKKNQASADDKSKYDSTNIEDYRTGEAISLKSNQLAYLVNIPSWEIVDNGKELYLKLPKSPIITDLFKEYWDLQKNVQKIPIVKSVISGKTYYFFDFSDTSLQNAKGMNEFIKAYADMFKVEEGATTSDGENLGLNNITDYDFFDIKMLKVNDVAATGEDGNPTDNYKNIYSNSAISIKDETSFKIIADSDSVTPLITAGAKIMDDVAEQNRYHSEETDKQRSTDLGITSKEDGGYSYSGDNGVLASKVTTELQSQYKEMRWMLTTTSRDYDGVTDAHAMGESDITPINYFFYFNKIAAAEGTEELSSGYKVWISDESLTISDKGDLKGLIICKGDVVFGKDVESFEGLIVSGGKIKIDHSMTVSSNEEIIKSILRECDESQKYGKNSNKNLFKICELFQKYQSIYVDENNKDAIDVVTTKNISAVQFEDILAFDNWKKNVD